MKHVAKLFVLIYSAFFITAIAYAATATAVSYYTKTNIWYEDPGKILSTNYHRGAIIPFCTKVNIISQTKDKISFFADNYP
jgi:hypothetical protein